MLKDDTKLTKLDPNWKLVLEGEGIITNMSGPAVNVLYRFDDKTPATDDASRVIYGRGEEKDSFVNHDEDSKIYAKSMGVDAEILVTRKIKV